MNIKLKIKQWRYKHGLITLDELIEVFSAKRNWYEARVADLRKMVGEFAKRIEHVTEPDTKAKLRGSALQAQQLLQLRESLLGDINLQLGILETSRWARKATPADIDLAIEEYLDEAEKPKAP